MLSPYIHLGCVSPRLFLAELREVTERVSTASFMALSFTCICHCCPCRLGCGRLLTAPARLPRQIYSKHKGHSKPPVSLEGQLLWREFFHLCGYAVDNYEQMKGNRICR